MSNKRAIGILTVQNDSHALMVSAALREMGHQPARIMLQDYPQITSSTFRIGSGYFEHLTNKETCSFDTLWVRRPRKTIISGDIHKEDKEFLEKEATIVNAATMEMYAKQGFTVNPLAAIKVAENKLLQLQHAVAVGFTIPDTLVSNDPAEVRAFIGRMDEAGFIYKALLPHSFISWTENKSVLTAAVGLSQLPSDFMLKYGGGIYQKKIIKRFELRITIFGKTLFAAKLHSQLHPQGKDDWRRIPDGELKVEPYDLPQDIQEKCFLLLERLGLVMGCFDFIVTPNNEYILLEVNQQGQFLWIEKNCPEINILEAFCLFLVTGSKNFHLPRNFQYNPALKLSSVIQSKVYQNEIGKEKATRHISIPTTFTIERELT